MMNTFESEWTIFKYCYIICILLIPSKKLCRGPQPLLLGSDTLVNCRGCNYSNADQRVFQNPLEQWQVFVRTDTGIWVDLFNFREKSFAYVDTGFPNLARFEHNIIVDFIIIATGFIIVWCIRYRVLSTSKKSNDLDLHLRFTPYRWSSSP